MRAKIEKTLHFVIFISTLWAIYFSFVGKVDVLGSGGVYCFRFYTTDSNVLACISSGLCLIFLIKKKWWHWLSIVRFVCTVAVSITFIVACVFLAPTLAINGGGAMTAAGLFTGTGFVLHLTTPVLSVIALMLSEDDVSLKLFEIFWAVIPVIIYSLVYLLMVVIVEAWPDFYGFTFGGHYWLSPIVMIVMYALVTGVAFGEWKLKRRFDFKQ